MRVIAGRFGGRRLVAPKGDQSRPTSDRVREALFSMLGPLDSLAVLDLYAGTGALGIEALSRGASTAVFVENSRVALRALQDNLAAMKIKEMEVHPFDVLRFVRNARQQQRTFDLVFLDPPYRMAEKVGQTLSPLLPSILTATARVICESDRAAPLELALPLYDQRQYGSTLVNIYGQ